MLPIYLKTEFDLIWFEVVYGFR